MDFLFLDIALFCVLTMISKNNKKWICFLLFITCGFDFINHLLYRFARPNNVLKKEWMQLLSNQIKNDLIKIAVHHRIDFEQEHHLFNNNLNFNLKNEKFQILCNGFLHCRNISLHSKKLE